MNMQTVKRKFRKVLDGKAVDTGIFEALKRRSPIGGRCGEDQRRMDTLIPMEKKSSLTPFAMAFVSVVAIIAVVMSFQFMTSGAHGRCSKDGKYPTDEEFIKAALKNDPVLLFKLDPSKIVQYADQIPQLAEDYLAKNPDCCKVFRERESEVSELSRAYWRDGVVVRVRTEKSLKEFGSGTKRLSGTGYALDDGIGYVSVGNCGGVAGIPELTPGG